MASWKIPRAWEGQTVAVLACGPSMSQDVADSVVSKVPTIAINNAFTLAPKADMLYACDAKFWLHYTDALKFSGIKVTLDQTLPSKAVNVLRNLGTSGFDGLDLTGLHTGHNSGFQAVQLAIKAGAKRVLLLGFDMHGSHFFGDHPAHLQDSDPHVFDRFIAEFEKVAPIYKNIGVDIVNCTPGSALTCFRSSTVEAELAERIDATIERLDAAAITYVKAVDAVSSKQESHMDRIDRMLSGNGNG